MNRKFIITPNNDGMGIKVVNEIDTNAKNSDNRVIYCIKVSKCLSIYTRNGEVFVECEMDTPEDISKTSNKGIPEDSNDVSFCNSCSGTESCSNDSCNKSFHKVTPKPCNKHCSGETCISSINGKSANNSGTNNPNIDTAKNKPDNNSTNNSANDNTNDGDYYHERLGISPDGEVYYHSHYHTSSNTDNYKSDCDSTESSSSFKKDIIHKEDDDLKHIKELIKIYDRTKSSSNNASDCNKKSNPYTSEKFNTNAIENKSDDYSFGDIARDFVETLEDFLNFDDFRKIL